MRAHDLRTLPDGFGSGESIPPTGTSSGRRQRDRDLWDRELSKAMTRYLRRDGVGFVDRATGFARLDDLAVVLQRPVDDILNVARSSSKCGEPRFRLSDDSTRILATTKNSLYRPVCASSLPPPPPPALGAPATPATQQPLPPPTYAQPAMDDVSVVVVANFNASRLPDGYVSVRKGETVRRIMYPDVEADWAVVRLSFSREGRSEGKVPLAMLEERATVLATSAADEASSESLAAVDSATAPSSASTVQSATDVLPRFRRAKGDFDATEYGDGAIGLEKGCHILVVGEEINGWIQARSADGQRTGWVPATLLEAMTESTVDALGSQATDLCVEPCADPADATRGWI